MEKVPMTVAGEQKLRQELDRLLKLRPKISEAIAEAVSYTHLTLPTNREV